MVMRYHCGLGIGHLYNHGQTADNSSFMVVQTSNLMDVNEPETSVMTERTISHLQDQLENESDVEIPEFGFENREDNDLGEEVGFEGFEDGFTDDTELPTMMDQ